MLYQLSTKQSSKPVLNSQQLQDLAKLWQELDDQQSEAVSGGGEGCLAWSIRFGDVRRSS